MRILWRLLRNLLVNAARFVRNGLGALFRRKGAIDFVRIELKGKLPVRRTRRAPPWFLRRFFPPPARITFEELDRRLTRIEGDARVRGVLLLLRHVSLGWGELVSLRKRLTALRDKGKELVVCLQEAGNAEYYLASAGNFVVLAPAGHLGLTGLAAEVRFYKETLHKLSAEAEVIAAGKYKSAFDPYTRTEMTPAHREAVEAILDDLSSELVTAVAEGRKQSPEAVRQRIDEGPYNPGRAKECGLIDAVGYEDEVEKLLGREKLRICDAHAYERMGPIAYDWIPLFGQHGLGYIALHGIIHTGESTRMPGRSATAGDETLRKAIDAARKARRVRAVVLHIDSRGGSGLASDLIWRAVLQLREKKPVIAYLGNVAASGGYYVACAANHVVASPGTLTGSIGVLAGKLNLGGLFERLGVRTEVLKRGASADLSSAIRGFTGEERERLERDIRFFYDDFVAKVAESRKLPREAVAEAAEGRVWTGTRALGLRLVDELGGFGVAVQRARELAKLPARAPVWNVGLEAAVPSLPSGPWVSFAEVLGDLGELTLLAEEAMLCLSPYELRIR
jgi:protease-4